jgi:hypothetical protein
MAAVTVRGKFCCTSVTHRKFTPDPNENQAREFVFEARYDESVPEDQRYAKYTPSGKLTITVDNPAIDWKPGQSYYLDLTPVEEEAGA